jgi:hypothetical protein
LIASVTVHTASAQLSVLNAFVKTGLAQVNSFHLHTLMGQGGRGWYAHWINLLCVWVKNNPKSRFFATARFVQKGLKAALAVKGVLV